MRILIKMTEKIEFIEYDEIGEKLKFSQNFLLGRLRVNYIILLLWFVQLLLVIFLQQLTLMILSLQFILCILMIDIIRINIKLTKEYKKEKIKLEKHLKNKK